MTRLWFLALFSFPVLAQAAPLQITDLERDTPVDFAKEIYPLFKKNCIACHNATKAKAKLNLESPDAIMKGSSGGEVVVPGKPMDSLLLIAAAHIDGEVAMPPEGNKSNAVNLTPEELGLLKLWIAQGAKGEAPAAAIGPPQWQKLAGNLKSIYATAVSPDKRWVACGRGNRIFLYDLAAGGAVTELADPALADSTGGAHKDVVQSLEFSASGQLASGGFRIVKLWSLPKVVERFDAADQAKVEPAHAARLKVEGNVVKVMKPDGSAPERQIDHGGKVIAAIADAPAQRIATLGEDGKAKLWEFATGKPLSTDLRSDAAVVRAFAVAERDQKASQAVLAVRKTQAAAAEKKVTEEIEKSKKAAQAAIAAETDFANKQAAFVAADEARQQADREVAAKEAAKHPQLAAAKAEAKKLTDEAKKKTAERDNSRRALVNATRNRELALRFSKRAGEARASAIVALAAAESESAARTATFEAAKKSAAEAVGKPKLTALAFSPDGKRLVAGADDGRLLAWGANDGSQIGRVGKNGAVITAVHFLGGGELIAAASGDAISRWETQPRWSLARAVGNGEDAKILGGRVNGLAFSPDGETLATGSGTASRNGNLKLWNVRDGKLLSEIKDAHSDTIADLAFSPDGKLIATAGMDRVARVFDVAAASPAGTFEGHGGHVLGISWRDDGRAFATAGADKKAKIWDLEAQKLIKNIDGFGHEVTAIEFVGLGEEIVTSSGDKNVRIGKQQLADPEKTFLYAVATSADGQIIAAGGDDGTLRIWDGKQKKSLFRFAP